MNLKEKLLLIKEKLLDETYKIDDLYIGLLLRVHKKQKKDLTYMGGYDWKWKDVITYELLDFITVKKIEEDVYKEIYTQKIYLTTNKVDIEKLEIGDQCIHPYVISYQQLNKLGLIEHLSNDMIKKSEITRINELTNKSKLKKKYKELKL